MERNQDASIEALQNIRSIMERSARFISLSGWSGVWAGSMALIGAVIANSWLAPLRGRTDLISLTYTDDIVIKLIGLACAVFFMAVVGGLYFTLRKVKRQGGTMWNMASKQFLVQMLIPLLTGGVFVIGLIHYGFGFLIAPACLMFYGLALVGGSKYTLSDIKYLDMLELLLGSICLFLPGYGLYFWAIGFGVLHILYGIIMWNKYDKQQ